MDDLQSESMEVDPSEVSGQSTIEGEKKASEGETNTSDGEKASEGEKNKDDNEKETSREEKSNDEGEKNVSDGEKDGNISEDVDGEGGISKGGSEPKIAYDDSETKNCEAADSADNKEKGDSAGSGDKEGLASEEEESMEVENSEKVPENEDYAPNKSGDSADAGLNDTAESKEKDDSSEVMDVSTDDDGKKLECDKNLGDTDVTNKDECSGERSDDTNSTKDISKEGSVSDIANDNAADVNTQMDCDDPKSTDKTAEDGASEADKEEEGKEKEDDSSATSIKEKDEGSDIEEIPVHKKPAEVVDLEEEEGEGDKKEEDSCADKDNDDDKKDDKKDDGDSNSKGLKLRSLASLVDTSENESPDSGEKSEPTPLKSGTLVPNPEAFGAIGEIVEHKDMFFDPESGGLPLRISSVVGGEDCITGLAMDDDRDMLSAIQISSVTTLIDPISPEDPNKDKDKDGDTGADQDVDAEKPDGANLESSEESGIKIVSAESLASKEDENEKSQDDSSGPKIRLSSAVSEVPKDDATKGASVTPSVVYHILRSNFTMARICRVCFKKLKCEFRITKKGHQGTFSFLCSTECRTKFSSNLKSSEVIEKPRLIFEKLCGMCHKDLTSQPRSGQFSWETREFCSEFCLTSHLEEVASKCHTCNITVRAMYIGKYCVRFGSDIHQFCSNHCLERYKTKIKVCCYCQKNVENVLKVTSPANKEYCSVKCLKRAQRRDIGQQNYSEIHPCTVCQTQGSNRYEFLVSGETQQLCSDPCLNVFKYVNKVKAVTCCLCFRVMNAEDVCHYLYHDGHQLRVFCSDSCVNVFILSARKIVVCDTCKVKKYNFDMIHRQVDEDFREYYYCSLHCLKVRGPGSSTSEYNPTLAG